jgi:6-phosphofructokinase 2
MKESLEYQPTGIKPNRYELSRLMGREIDSESEILAACDQIHDKGIAYVLVSMGREGMILSTEKIKIKAVGPPVEVESPVGAGDSAVAGFILAHSQGKDLEECVRLACASGTASAKTPGTELCHRADVEELLSLVKISHF